MFLFQRGCSFIKKGMEVGSDVLQQNFVNQVSSRVKSIINLFGLVWVEKDSVKFFRFCLEVFSWLSSWRNPPLWRVFFFSSLLCTFHAGNNHLCSSLLTCLCYEFSSFLSIFRRKGEFLTILLLLVLFSLGFLAPKSCCGWVSLPFYTLKSVQIPFFSLSLCQNFICSLQQCKGCGSIFILPNTITLLAYFKIVHFKTPASDFKPCPPQKSGIFPDFLHFVFRFMVWVQICVVLGGFVSNLCQISEIHAVTEHLYWNYILLLMIFIITFLISLF